MCKGLAQGLGAVIPGRRDCLLVDRPVPALSAASGVLRGIARMTQNAMRSSATLIGSVVDGIADLMRSGVIQSEAMRHGRQ